MSASSRPMLSAARLALGLAIALGFARFAYALVLNPMRQELGWSYTQAGLVNTANAVGYLAGSLLATSLARRIGLRRAFQWACVATVVCIFGMGALPDYGWLLAVRGAAGVTAAVVFITGGSLSATLASESPGRSGLIVSTYFSGVGIGIIASGIALPPLLAWMPGFGWQAAWLLLGVFAIGLCAVAVSAPVTGAALPAAAGPATVAWPTLVPAMAGYFLFGAGYITYMTFIIAFLQSPATGVVTISLAWTMLGVGVLAAPIAWRRPLERLAPGAGIAAPILVVGIATALPLFSQTAPAIVLSGALFGLSFLTVVSAITLLVRRGLPREQWTRGLAIFTVAFSAGQAVGPTLSGALADALGGLGTGLAFSALALFLGAAIAARQRNLSVLP